MLDYEVIPTWLMALLAIALFFMAAYLVNIWRKHRAMERKNKNILRTRRSDEAKWNALQEKQRKREADQTSS
jgi:cell division protein FtsL